MSGNKTFTLPRARVEKYFTYFAGEQFYQAEIPFRTEREARKLSKWFNAIRRKAKGG